MLEPEIERDSESQIISGCLQCVHTRYNRTKNKYLSELHRPVSIKEAECKKVTFYLKKVEVRQHFGHPLSVASFIKEVKLQRHVLLGLLHQPHEGKIWEEPVDHLQQHLQFTNRISLTVNFNKTGVYIQWQ